MKIAFIFTIVIVAILLILDYSSIRQDNKKEIDIPQVFDIEGHRIVVNKNSIDFSDFHGTVHGYWNEARDTFFHELTLSKK